MLKKENRLKKNTHFNYIYKHGTSIKYGVMALVFIKFKVKPFKVGFSVSNKIGKSVVRNKIKRRMREAFRNILPMVDKRYNYIFVAKEGITEKTFEEIKNNMFEIIKKAGLINDCVN